MPLIVFRVCRAEPAVTLIAEDCGGFVARLVQVGNCFARGLYFLICLFAGLFRFHDDTRAAILLPSANSRKKSGNSRNRSAARAVFAHGFIDQRI
jgi:hypothetical protein